MKFLFHYMKRYAGMVATAILLKLISTILELGIPYILEYMIDEVVPMGEMKLVIEIGLLLFLAAILSWGFNISANSLAIRNAHLISYNVRQDLFVRTANLSGRQFDFFGLPSLISRMTSDSYNVQSGVQQLQSICVRAPMMLVGGLLMMTVMDFHLSLILVVMVPFLFAIIILVSSRSIPLFVKVQKKLDDIVRIMREDITGIRVVKALSKTEYEKKHFRDANQNMTDADVKASTVMALPSPLLQLLLNIGLTLVVYVGANRVNEGLTEPGVIVAFLTYYNMITMGVMGLSRIFMSLSKASASANRIAEVVYSENDQEILSIEEGEKPHGDEFIRFEHVTFSYVKDTEESRKHFSGGERQNTLTDIDFAVKKGESLGIIGPTGCGKSSIINLLMRFYDATEGTVFIGGRDVRTYDKDELHKKFGTVFQNDMIFQDTLRENISFSRKLSEEQVEAAARDAQAMEFIQETEKGLDHRADIKGANLSGGQKQRLFVARALAGNPEILVLDDSSSALDYKTDALMRKAISEHHKDSTLILIAQRVSSVMNMKHIMVMDNGRCIGYGTHEELLKSCPAYLETYKSQMGDLE